MVHPDGRRCHAAASRGSRVPYDVSSRPSSGRPPQDPSLMPEPPIVTVYIDYKSPYAFLAKDLVYALEGDFAVRLDWLPYDLDLTDFMGSARIDDSGRVIEQNRTPHQWRRARYSYMDCRRQARKRGLVLRATQKIWDSRPALCGMLHAKRQGGTVLRGYQDMTFERFWRRELDLEDPIAVAGVLAAAGADTAGFADYLADEGPRDLDRICREAEAKGVFGVPSLIVENELFWGREHLPDIHEMLAGYARNAR
jgi:2-hydroxychromene-2-carboxylate isomerase